MMLVRPLLACLPFTLLLLAAARPLPLGAQTYRKFEGAEILTIQFDPARQPLDSGELHGILPLKMRAPLHIADVRASIEKLFATGRYRDIQVDVKPYDSGVAVTFLTSNAWFTGDISVQGEVASPPTAGQIENAARLDLGTPFSESRLQEALTGQRVLLENNGLYGSSITPALDYDSAAAFQQVNLRFNVQSGRRATFGEPLFVGDLKLDSRRVLAATRFQRPILHSWKPVTQTRLRQGLDGVRSLYQKEGRLESKVTLESVRYDGATNKVYPTIRVDAGPRIRLNTIGTKVSQKKLQRYVPVFEERSVDHDLLAEGARNLTDYFQSRGYFDAQVQVKEQRVANDQATVDYLINTGGRHKLVYIGIAGNKYFSSEALRDRLFLRTAAFLQFPHGRYSESLLRHDESSIVNLYQSNGFRDAAVTHRLVDDYQGKAGNQAVLIDVNEGPQSFIASLQVDGIEQLDKPDLLSRLSSVAGQPFSEYNVAVDRDAILGQYFEKGFPSATFEWSSKPAAQPNQVDLRFTVREGKRQTVREVVATGLNRTRESLVTQNFTLSPGDPLSPTAITDIQRRLYDLGVFAKVDAAIQDPDGETDSKYVLYNLDEARRYSVAAGFGAELGRIGGCQTCLEAPAGSAGFSPRVSLNLTRNNLWGVAHSISLRSRASTLDQRAILNYSWPRFEQSENLNLSFTGLAEKSLDIRTFNSKRLEASAQLSQRLSKTTTLFYRYTYRRVGVSDLKITNFLVGILSQPVRVGIPNVSVVQDRRDDPVDPHKGIYNTVDFGVAEGVFGSQRNFTRLLARNASYHQLSKRLVLARSTEFGDIHPFGAGATGLDAVPLAERFFGGGGTSQRGFAENQAGPRDTSTGFPLGGTALFFNQTELRFAVIGENIGGVLFHDAGNVYSTLKSFSFRTGQRDSQDFDYMVHAVGLGLRYRTPVGPVRADFAYSVNPPQFFGFPSNATETDLVNAGPNPCSPPAGVANKCTLQSAGHFQFFISIGQTF